MTDLDIIKECRQTGRTRTTTKNLLQKAYYKQMTETNRQEYKEKIDKIIEWTKTAPTEKVSAFYENEQVQGVMKRLEKNTEEYEQLIEKHKMEEIK